MFMVGCGSPEQPPLMPDGSLSARPRIRSTGRFVRARRRPPDGSREPWGHASRCLVGSSEGSRTGGHTRAQRRGGGHEGRDVLT
eukprot:COSAG01_NODE_6543_length_3614_cov_8.708962_2_plen_84_part_00